MLTSTQLLEQARAVIPGGVNSPVRAFGAVEGDPPFITSGSGAWIQDVEGRRYLDLVGSWGPMILGHAHPEVETAVIEALRLGASFGAPTEGEVRFAELLTRSVPGLEQVRVVSSGTEATMHALRLARGYTGRDAIIKLDGCYHGAHDAVLVSAGSGVATFARPGSPGIIAPATLTAPFNDLEIVARHLRERPVAAIIVEPVPGNMGCIAPEPGYLEGLRRLTAEAGALLIFDEVMTGFRLAKGGAAERFGIQPDLICMGKVIGGGLPLAAFGGRREVMQRLSPVGPVYQAGTLSGNPLAVAAGMKTLEVLFRPGQFAALEAVGDAVDARLRPVAEARGLSMTRVGSMFTLFFRPSPPKNFEEVKECDLRRFGRFHRACLERGLYLPCSQFEAAFLSLAMSEADLEHLERVVREAMDATAA